MEDIHQIVFQNLQQVRSSRAKRYRSVIFTFEDIRKSFIFNQIGIIHKFLEEDGRDRINRGRKSLETIEECIQYWFTYCKNFVPKPWEDLANRYEKLQMHQQPVEIYDYASGQGQATILLLDHFYGSQNKIKIIAINLIEKSAFALNIAKEILKNHSPEISPQKINLISKDINQIELNEFDSKAGSYKIHLFSQILDMGVIDAKKLIEKILSIPGRHFIWAVSQNSNYEKININSKTNISYFKEFYNELEMQIESNPTIEKKSEIYQIDLHEATLKSRDGQEKPYIIFGRYITIK